MKFLKYIVLTLVLSGLTACQFDDINLNPNAPSIDKANPALILPKIQYEVGNNMTAGLGWGLGNIVMQLAATNNFTGNDIYAWGTYEGTWNMMYRNLRDAQNLQQIGEQRGNENLQAAALVLKSWMFSILTEMYGNIPYTQALDGKAESAVFKPVYDDQATIYRGILADYETALSLFNENDDIEGDIMYGGDPVQWEKLANSLRFRTIMRLENKWDELGINGAQLLQGIVDSGIWMGAIEDGGKVDYLPTGVNRWPLHVARVGSFDEKRMSITAETALKAIDDPRLAILYRPVDNPDSAGIFKGVSNGLSEDNASNFNGGAKNQSRLGTMFRESPDAVDMVVMHYPEFLFLLAEAAEKGYISGGSDQAETFYLEGIAATMEIYGATPTADYYTQEGVEYNLNANESKLELIGKQKWLSLFTVGLEAWFDWRRTGLPAIQPGPDAILSSVPVRIQYPDNEKALNLDNYNSAVSAQGPDEINTEMWLLQ